MQFEIGNFWHWMFIAGATVTSAWNACRVFFASYEANHAFAVAPFYAFWYELAATMAGWMGLWKLAPALLECSGADCRLTGSWVQYGLACVAILAVSGFIPVIVESIVHRVGRLVAH